jgi:hypothetical protein
VSHKHYIGPANNRLSCHFQLLWKPNVILIAKSNPFAPTQASCLQEVVRVPKPLWIEENTDGKGGRRGEAIHNIYCLVARSIIADDQFKRTIRLVCKALKLLAYETGSIVRRQCN